MSQTINRKQLAIKLAAWLQCWRLKITDELIAEYARSLASFTESEVLTALERAKNENRTEYAPVPGVIYAIILEMRRGQIFDDDERDCASCSGTGYRVLTTHAGEVAIVCKCVKPETGAKIEKYLGQNEFHSAKRFAKHERHERRTAAGDAEKHLPSAEKPGPSAHQAEGLAR